MAKPHYQSVDEYLAAQPAAVRKILALLRAAIRKAVPAAEESISYQIPTYKLDGEPVLYLAGWKHHYSLYPATARVLATFGDELTAYEVNKSTIRFPLSQSVPVNLVERIAKFRAQEIVGRQKDPDGTPHQ